MLLTHILGLFEFPYSLSGGSTMIIISSFRELEPFGLIILTGEACGLGYRSLFDVTAAGKRSSRSASEFQT